MDYMRMNRESLRELISLEYKIEMKVEEDLIKAGFKLRKRTHVPKYILDIIGKI